MFSTFSFFKTYGDDGIFWRVNFDKYVQYFRDEIIIKAFESKIDKNASNLVRIMINTSNSPSEEILIQTKPVTLIDVRHVLFNRTTYEEKLFE